MTLEHLSVLLRSLVPSLGDHLWQSTVFSGAAALAAFGTRRNFARTRYWIWLAASLKFLIPFSILLDAGAALMPHRNLAPSSGAIYDFVAVIGRPVSIQRASSLNHVVRELHSGTMHSAVAPLFFTTIWMIGTLSVLATWTVLWWRVRALVLLAAKAVEGPELRALQNLQEAGFVGTNVRLLLSERNVGPGVYGMSHPKVLWPSRISTKLTAAQIEAILAHELCHIERRDNLTAFLHMTVEAIFWFHPLVWWLGSRLEQERERACDERVLHLTRDRHAYAESILKVCETCLVAPLECVSGVTSSDLKERISRIMTSPTPHGLARSGKAMLVVAAFSCVAVPVVFGQRMSSAALTLQDTTTESKPSFEVATIKPVENGPKTPRFLKLEGDHRFVVRDYNLKLLIAAAYNMNPKAISGGPSWIESDFFDILALTPGQARPSRQDQMAMLQRLLEERFKLAFHREQKTFSIYALTVARGGPKLDPASPGTTEPPSVGPGMVYPQKVVMPGHNATMNDLASLLQRAVLDRPVVDMTGLKGRYDFSLEWAPDESQFGGGLPAASADAPSPPLFTAIQQQLGLKLDPRKGPVAAIVIDNAQHPTAN